MKKYNVIYLLLLVVFLASCAEDDLPQPEVKTVQLTGTVNVVDEFGVALTGVDLSDANITLLRQGFNSVVGGLSANADGTYSLADLPIREYGILVEKTGYNQVLESNNFSVNSSANSEQRLVVDIPENAENTNYEVNLYLRQASSTKVMSASNSRDAGGSQGITTTVNGSIESGTVSTGFKRGVYAYFSNTSTPTNEDFLYSVFVPINSGSTSFNFSFTDFDLLNNGFSSGENVSVAFYGLTTDDSNNIVTIANSELFSQNGIFTLP